MYHLDNTSGVPEMPEPKDTQTISTRWFGESQEQGGISWPGADWFNILQAEMLSIMEKAGLEPDKKKFNQVAQSIDVLSELIVKEKVGPEAAADFLGYLAEKQRASQRVVRSKLNDIPCILDYRTDSQSDDSLRLRLAIEDGCDNLFIPGRQEFRPFYIGEIDIPTSIRFWGNGSQSINADGSVFIKLTDAAYGFHFDGQGQAQRPMGGGFHNIHLRGLSATDEGDLVKVTSWSYFKTINCAFNNLAGYALKLRDCMESSVKDSLFRRLGSDSTGVILLDDYLGSLNSNVNNLHISGNTFGLNSGAWIKASANANSDLIWIDSNKFEFDGIPASPNATPQFVIDLGRVSRVWLHDNGFTHFRTGNNNYAGCIVLREGALYTTRVTQNEFYACEKAWDVRGGSLFARGNRSNSVDYAAIQTAVSSTAQQDIEPITNHSSNGNVTRLGEIGSPDFISAHRMAGTISSTFSTDAESSESTVLAATVGNEIRRFSLAQHLLDDVSVVNVFARVKAAASGGLIKLNIDASLDKSTISVPSDKWTLVKWQLKPTETLTGSLRLLNVGTSTILFDGMFVERSSYIDWEFSWSPGQVPANSQVTSPLQSYTDMVGVTGLVKGFSVPAFNSSISGLIINTNTYNANGSFTISLYNNGINPVNVGFSRVSVRLFLF